MPSSTLVSGQLQQRARTALVALFVAVTAFLLYFPTLQAGWTDTDDIQLIVEDARFLTTGSAVPDAFQRPFFPAGGAMKRYYRPLVTLSFMADAGHKARLRHAHFTPPTRSCTSWPVYWYISWRAA